MNVVIENIKRRSEEVKLGVKSDITTGLVVQGGGMRGTYSMSSLATLEECGFGHAFDHVLGSSAGAINGAYFLAGQARMAVTVYLDDISNRKFVNFLRWSKIVDVDFLVDGVLTKHKALDVDKVQRSKSKLQVILTDYITGESIAMTFPDQNTDLMETLRATAAMPILYNRVITINGCEYIDGAVTDSIPIMKAVEAGCSDILVVLTRLPDFRYKKVNFFLRLITMPMLKDYPEATRKVIYSEDKSFNRAMEIVTKLQNVRIAFVYPSDQKAMVSRITTDRRKLLACALMARNDMRKALGLEPLIDNPYNS